jgi:hypothetical protein
LAHRTFIIHDRGIAFGLFSGNSPHPNTFNGKENGGTSQQELTKLKDWVLSPTLKKQNPTTQ